MGQARSQEDDKKFNMWHEIKREERFLSAVRMEERSLHDKGRRERAADGPSGAAVLDPGLEALTGEEGPATEEAGGQEKPSKDLLHLARYQALHQELGMQMGTDAVLLSSLLSDLETCLTLRSPG